MITVCILNENLNFKIKTDDILTTLFWTFDDFSWPLTIHFVCEVFQFSSFSPFPVLFCGTDFDRLLVQSRRREWELENYLSNFSILDFEFFDEIHDKLDRLLICSNVPESSFYP